MWAEEGGGRKVTAAETGPRGSRPGDLHRRRVLLVAEGAGLAAVLSQLLGPADRISRVGSMSELAATRALESTDVVVLDVPAGGRPGAVGEVRRRYLGPLVVLVGRGEDTGGLRLDDATLLARPFSTDELTAALAAPARAPRTGPFWTTINAAGPATAAPVAPTQAEAAATAATGPADPAPATVDPKAAARKAPVQPAPATPPGQVGPVERVRRLLVAVTQGWQARRRVRVAGFSVFAVVAFTAAFAMAAQGRCGPGCDALGTGFSPAPTVAPAESRAPATSAPKQPASTTAGTASPGTGAFRGISQGRLAAPTTTRRATTTTRPKGSPTTRPATTRPATTQSTAPPTTAPVTTAPPTTAPPTTT
jgi:hypothetical protein